jgi:hypothetical protein
VISLAAVLIPIAGLVVTEAPASAASGMQICLRGRYGPLTDVRVKSQLLWDGVWYDYQQAWTGSTGCASFYHTGTNVAAQNYYARPVVDHYSSSGYRLTYTPSNMAYSGSQWATFGTVSPICIPTTQAGTAWCRTYVNLF